MITRRHSLIWCAFIFVVFYCLKGFVGYDWIGYYPLFESIDDLFHFSSDSFTVVLNNGQDYDMVEPGFVIYVSIIKTLFRSWDVFVFITTLIPIIVFSKLISKFSCNIAFSFALFLALYQTLLIDLMRNALSLSLFLIGLMYIKKGEKLQLLALCLIGNLIHRSFILLIPFYFLKNVKAPLIVIWCFFIFVNALFVLQIPLFKLFLSFIHPIIGGSDFEMMVDIYSNKESYSAARGFTPGYFIRIFVFLVMMFHINKIYSEKNLIVFFNAYLLYVFVSIGLSDMKVFADRMEYVLCFALLVLYPHLIKILEPRYKVLFTVFLLLFCGLKIYQGNNTIMSQYETMFSGKTFEKAYSIKRPIAEMIMDNNSQ